MITKPTPHIETIFDPADDIIQTIKSGLRDFNRSALEPEVFYDYAKIAIVARDPDGSITGGIVGEFIWGGLKIETVWVAQEKRGQDIGSGLLRQAEETARQRGVSLLFLETASFQARAFYEKNGFSVYGQLDNYPPGCTWYHLKKNL